MLPNFVHITLMADIYVAAFGIICAWDLTIVISTILTNLPGFTGVLIQGALDGGALKALPTLFSSTPHDTSLFNARTLMLTRALVSCRRNRTNTQSSSEISSPQNVAQKGTVSDDVDDQRQHDKITSDSKDRSKAKRSWRNIMGRKERLKAGEADLQ